MKMGRREIYSLGRGLLADEEKGESKEIFLFSPFTHENEEKRNNSLDFPFILIGAPTCWILPHITNTRNVDFSVSALELIV